MSSFEWTKCTKCGDTRSVPVNALASGQDYCPACSPRTAVDRAYRNDVISRKRRSTRERNRKRLALVFYAKPGTHPACYLLQVGRRGRIEVGDRVQAVPCDPRTGRQIDPGERPRGWLCREVRDAGGQRLHVLEAW